MGCYISLEAPIYKEWQFQYLEKGKGIKKEQWLQIVEELDNLKSSKTDPERFNLYSIQNPSFYIHLWHNPHEGNAITFSSFPERFMGEFVKHINIICQKLNATFYILDNNGQPKEFNFRKYQKAIDKEYFNLQEEKVTDIEVSEHIGLITFPTWDINKVVNKLNLKEIGESNWEEAVKKCYDSKKFLVRYYGNWITLIGQPENLTAKFGDKLDDPLKTKTYLLDLLKKLSQDFGRIGYNFNSSKYGVFENYKFENGKIAYKYIHKDGDEIIEGETKKEYFNDFKSLCYDKSILKGVKIYE